MMTKPLFDAYPLHWPEGQTRKAPSSRRVGAFKVSLGIAPDELMNELRLLGARDVVVTSNVPTRRDGLPYADAREPADPGVAVYFERKAHQYVFACDTFTKFVQNLRAIGMTVAALRAIQRSRCSSRRSLDSRLFRRRHIRVRGGTCLAFRKARRATRSLARIVSS